jgi:hypothetical protein
MFNIDFPANVKIFFSFLANLASFNVFSTDSILFFFKFNETIQYYNEEFNDMGYGSMNII